MRCLVCQNESIDDSEAELAGDLRRIVREQVRQGRSDAEIKRFLTDRYGEFVLLTPAFNVGNLALWGGPFLAVALGMGAVVAPPEEPIRERRPLQGSVARRGRTRRTAVEKRFHLT